jgi:hypothetical protein
VASEVLSAGAVMTDPLLPVRGFRHTVVKTDKRTCDSI